MINASTLILMVGATWGCCFQMESLQIYDKIFFPSVITGNISDSYMYLAMDDFSNLLPQNEKIVG